MIIAVDFDNTVVEQDGRLYADVTTPLRLLPGAKEGLLALKAADHVLVLWSGRANRALRFDPRLDPLVKAGVRRQYSEADLDRWRNDSMPLNQARYQQMLDFVTAELPGVFAAVDDGEVGKITADLYMDDRAVRFGRGLGGARWIDIAKTYGVRTESGR